MLVFDGDSKPTILDSIHTPTAVDHIWVLDLAMMDFTMTELVVLEEVVCPTMEVEIGGFRFLLPAFWNIVVYDRDTSQLDVVKVSEAAGRDFTAFVYGPNKAKPTPKPISVTNYLAGYPNVTPSLNKHQMLCHPIGPDEWVVISGSDRYNKYLKDTVVGDIVN